MKGFEANKFNKRMALYQKIITEIKKVPLEDVTQRNFRMAGVITDLFKMTGAITPIVVGGLSVNIYTEGEYATQDIDMMGVVDDAIDKGFQQLGFVKKGRHYINEELQIFIEFPSQPFSGEESLTSERITEDFLPVRIIGIEDILIDRIRARINWHEVYQTEWIREMWLRHQEDIDVDYIQKRLTLRETEFFDKVLKAYSTEGHNGKELARKFELELEISYHSRHERRVFYSISEEEDTLILFPGPSTFDADKLFGEYFAISFYPVLNLFLKNLNSAKYHPYIENYKKGMTVDEVVEAVQQISKRAVELGEKRNDFDQLIAILNLMK